MLSPTEFVARWGKDVPLIRFPTKAVEGLSLSKDDKAFLTQAGLPEDAAPFLTFDVSDSGQLPTVAEQWNQPQAFAAYRVIGSDGSGNPIALDGNKNGEVVLLDHENKFARILMNTSIGQLAESLLAYRKFVRDSQEEFGPDAFLEGKTSPAARKGLRQDLATIDAAAMKAGCFWHGELQNLDANAG
jgi:SUKH-4 immunity protein of toxin-antitoxin system